MTGIKKTKQLIQCSHEMKNNVPWNMTVEKLLEYQTYLLYMAFSPGEMVFDARKKWKIKHEKKSFLYRFFLDCFLLKII